MAQHSYATCQKRDCHGAQKTHAESPVESYTAFEQQRPLHVRDRLRHLDPARAAVRAVEHRPAAPGARVVVEQREPLSGRAVTRVEDEAVRRDDRLRPDVPLVAHEHRTGARAGRTQDALGGVIEAGLLRLGLQPFGVGNRLVVDEVGKDRPVLVEERLHVDDEVFQHS
jgi:hypothetical protein